MKLLSVVVFLEGKFLDQFIDTKVFLTRQRAINFLKEEGYVYSRNLCKWILEEGDFAAVIFPRRVK